MSLISTLKESTKTFIRAKINPYVFKISEQPMRFQELMHANKIYNDGMNLEYNMTGFRVRLGRIYLVFFFLSLLIAIPPSIIFHSVLAKIDCHALIILSIVLTVLLFSTFALFKSWLIEQVSKQLIMEGWKNHFPHFDYKKNTQKVSRIYTEALENGIKTKDLQHYIITHMVSDTWAMGQLEFEQEFEEFASKIPSFLSSTHFSTTFQEYKNIQDQMRLITFDKLPKAVQDSDDFSYLHQECQRVLDEIISLYTKLDDIFRMDQQTLGKFCSYDLKKAEQEIANNLEKSAHLRQEFDRISEKERKLFERLTDPFVSEEI